MIYLVAFVALVLATARLTRLIYFDDITIPFRAGIDRKFGQQSFISRMVWCPWCAGVWASGFCCTVAAVGAWSFMPNTIALIVAWVLLIPAVAYPASWIVDFETSRTSRGE